MVDALRCDVRGWPLSAFNGVRAEGSILSGMVRVKEEKGHPTQLISGGPDLVAQVMHLE